MRVLAISSAYGGAEAAIMENGRPMAEARFAGERGLAGVLPGLIERLLGSAGRRLNLVAVAVGPGSFTSLRAGIALASGIAVGLGIPIVGVTVAEAFAEALPGIGGRTLWTAIEARRGRLFLDIGAGARGMPTDAIPETRDRIAICGNAANWVAASLAARGVDVMLTAARFAFPAEIAAVGLQRWNGLRQPLAVVPMYVDAPEARLPEAGLRAPPQ